MRDRKIQKIEKREGRPIRGVIVDLYHQHGNQTAVAAALGISQSRLSQIIREQRLQVKSILVPMEETR